MEGRGVDRRRRGERAFRISDISPGGGVERRKEGEEISGSGHSTSKLMRARDSCVGMASGG